MANAGKHSRYNGPRVLWAVCYGQRCLGTSVETDVINDEKGFESLPGIICCVFWHGPVMEFIPYLPYMYISNKKYMSCQFQFMEILQNILHPRPLKFPISQHFPLCQNLEYFPGG